MANKKKKSKSAPAQKNEKVNIKEGYVVSMGYCNRIDTDYSVLQMIPATIFTAIVILIVRSHRYFRDMSEFFWSNQNGGTPEDPKLTDFFSYYKSSLIILCAILVLAFILFRIVTQSFAIKKSSLYIPMIVYFVFTLLSFAFSDYKEIAWEGWNERFEGTLVLMCYMLMLFYIINTVNTERSIKWIIYPLAGSSVVLSLLGVSQAIGKDFFQTVLGQMLILSNETMSDGTTTHELVKQAAENGERYLKFTFQNNEIYQTVYNINYVSFYLTLLIPLFSIIFVREQRIVQKIIWGIITFLIFFNLIGSASSGGLLGCGIVLVITIVFLNKRIIKWKWSMCILLLIILTTAFTSYALAGKLNSVKWTNEFTNAVQQSVSSDFVPSEMKFHSLVTEGNTLYFDYNGEQAEMTVTDDGIFTMIDSSGKELSSSSSFPFDAISVQDSRFKGLNIVPVELQEKRPAIGLQIEGSDMIWPFALVNEGNELKFFNRLGYPVTLTDVPHFGFESNPGFGSGRGYIWSASLPMIRDTLFIGFGADTYCVSFPHNDYLGKYNRGWGGNMDMIVDKPHNMYIGIAINTGVISLLALFALFGIYLVQSAKLYWKEKNFDTFESVAGFGIALGITGFLISAIVNDSSVSVMPMFYGLLGTGIASNMIVKRNRESKKA